jgi:predicted kinase
MARFDSAGEFDRMAREGRLALGLVEALADRVAAMHAMAPVSRSAGHGDGLAARIDQIAGALHEAEAGRLGQAAAAWAAAAVGEARALHRLAEARGRHGFVRRCHGDLHLGNICLWRGEPTPFDALEFNEAIATTDILYDAAFVVMDLIEHGLPALAAGFLARYLSATRDHAGLSLLPLFVSMRAAVRAIGAAGSDPARAAARLGLAQTVLAPRPRPRLIAIGGPSGSGKSTLARAVAPSIGAPLFGVILRSDVTRKRLLGLAPEAHLDAAAYGPGIGERVYTRMLAEARRTLRAGFDAILDAAFLRPGQQAEAARLAAAEGVAMHGFWLSAPAAVMVDRIAARRDDASDATPEVLAQQLAAHPDAPSWTHLDASRPPDAVAAQALAELSGG